ncbi:L,D-transpeptidase family protein [Inquilinus limosus]|uniref:L,D-transpeptidase family protein n=1 Tax=Inquilinus limosus TaxID=171674 RepID=UPI0004135DDC|nr:L,D-transpeptidase family protein [Inquilinus limosus]
MDVVVSPKGWIDWGAGRRACALGRGGVRPDKREGDGATPSGRFPLRRALYRPDRGPAPATALPCAPIAPVDGWCDDPADPAYNRPVRLPHPARHERMWRDDGLYDLVVVIGHNDDPPVAGLGSAVFVHLARPDGGPTEGCVALSRADLLDLLAAAAPGDTLVVLPR